jgi:UDP-N-acetyl-D-mannosaminuronate dehydrogenase
MKDIKIAVIGLGYVGLPLARLFSTKYPTVGYDLNPKRVEELMNGHDSTFEVDDSLQQYNAHVTVHDPWASPEVARCEYGVEIANELPHDTFDAVILAVAHDTFKEIDFDTLKNGHTVIYDVKGILQGNIDGKL